MTDAAAASNMTIDIHQTDKNPIPSLAALFLSGLYPMTKIRRRNLVGGGGGAGSNFGYLIDLIVALIVYWKLNQSSSSSTTSIVPFWSILTSLTCKLWPILITTTTTKNNDNNTRRRLLQMLIHGGPLGYGCKKLVEVLVAIFLWKFCCKHKWPSIRIFSTLPTLKECLLIMILSILVNVVLQIWSTAMKSRGDHKGVNDMVESLTQSRQLSYIEHIQIFTLAILNASCEEITTRYFWRSEIEYYLPSSSSSSTLLSRSKSSSSSSPYDWMYSNSKSNLAQAILFGLWHYHGIPSGWIGVVLTFAYGYIMGILQDYQNGGLFLAILTHGIADYYIFAFIARQKQEGVGAKQKQG